MHQNLNQYGDGSFEKENYMESGRAIQAMELFPGRLVEIERGENSEVVLTCDNSVKMRILALEDGLLQFTFATDGHLGDGFSYAALPENFTDRPKLQVKEDPHHVRISTEDLFVRIDKDALRLTIENAAGTVLSDDDKGFHWEPNKNFGGNIVLYSRKVQSHEHFFGLGDKSCHPDLRGRRFSLWGSDTYAYGQDTDPLYKSIPFFVGLHHGMAYGIFFDNSHRSFFDFGKERQDVSSFWAQGGAMDFYFINGPTIAEVVKRFARLTGLPEMPPRWAMGFHQCKWSYRTEDELTRIAQGFLDHNIPCDALYVDIDYMDGYRCFTWNSESFPKPGEMIRGLEEKGFKTVAIIDPGIKVDPGYWVYDQGIAGDHFCRQMDGDLYTGQVWPGACHFPDFTKPVTRVWWATLFKGLIEEDGIAGIWNDMNEPADFNEMKTFPRHIRHDYDGHPCSHRRAHNVYGTQMIRATREGLIQFGSGKRPFAITRSAYAGAWRYASAWTGDNISTWEHLRIANMQCQRLNLSGYSFVGSDIGGFLEACEGELFTRWIQLGIFHPFCRVHSSGENGDQEPWSFGEPYTSIVRKFIELRYRLMPYLYSNFQNHVATGEPFLRPLVYLDSADSETFHRADEFFCGDHLFTCPIVEKESTGRWLYLPKGHYFDFWTDKLTNGGEELYCDAPLDRTPLFVRAGAIIPLDPVRQFTWQTLNDPREYHLFAPQLGQAAVRSRLYDDEGEYLNYRDGLFCEVDFEVERVSEKSIRVRATYQGEFKLPRARFHLHGLKKEPLELNIDGEKHVPSMCFEVPKRFSEILIELQS